MSPPAGEAPRGLGVARGAGRFSCYCKASPFAGKRPFGDVRTSLPSGLLPWSPRWILGEAEAASCGSRWRPHSSSTAAIQTETACLKPVPAVLDRRRSGTFGSSQGTESRDFARARGRHEDFLILADSPARPPVLRGAPLQLSRLPRCPPRCRPTYQATVRPV